MRKQIFEVGKRKVFPNLIKHKMYDEFEALKNKWGATSLRFEPNQLENQMKDWVWHSPLLVEGRFEEKVLNENLTKEASARLKKVLKNREKLTLIEQHLNFQLKQGEPLFNISRAYVGSSSLNNEQRKERLVLLEGMLGSPYQNEIEKMKMKYMFYQPQNENPHQRDEMDDLVIIAARENQKKS